MKQRLRLTLLAAVAAVINLHAQVRLNADNFPDANFRKYLAGRLQINDGDEISKDHIFSLNSIYCQGEDIASLQGIEKFPNLKTLVCYDNKLTSLDLSKNTILTYLSCGYNQLTSLNLSGCILLKRLYYEDNQLPSFDLSQFKALEELDCSNNKVTSLDVSKNTALSELFCDDNQLVSLDVSENTALTVLYCNRNQLTSLDVSKNTELAKLNCNSNQLTSLDLSSNTALKELECCANQLTSLDVSNNTALTELECYFNKIDEAAMNTLAQSMPTVTDGRFFPFVGVTVPVYTEGNVCSTVAVKAAKDKGWKVVTVDSEYKEVEYAGSTPTAIRNLTLDPGSSANALSPDGGYNFYTLDGRRLNGKPTASGVYVVRPSDGRLQGKNGKKIFVNIR